MFDSNAFINLIDSQIDQNDFYDKCNKKYEFYVSAVQVEELAQIGDEKKDKRIANMLCLCQMRAKLVHPIAVLGHSRFGYCVFADENDKTYENLLNENCSNVNDAMIGEVAKREGCILITDDTRFIKKLKNEGIPTMTFREFKESV